MPGLWNKSNREWNVKGDYPFSIIDRLIGPKMRNTLGEFTMTKRMASTAKWFWFTVCLVLAAPPVRGQNDEIKKALEDSPRHHEWVEIPVGDSAKLAGVVVFPEVKGEADIVIVIHENRGLTDWVRLIGDKVAAEGYVAFCPDFLTGKGPGGGNTDAFVSSDDARKAIYELDPDGITKGLQAALKYFRDLPSTTDKATAIGFCWGGAQTFRFATNEPSLAAACVFYGGPPEEGFERIACPVYGFYGENDNRINATIEVTQEKMKAAGKIYEPVIYEGAGHGFLRAGMEPDASESEKQAVKAAWERFLGHLD